MLKRLTRYTLLILTLLLAGVWATSLFFSYGISDRGWNTRSISAERGTLVYGHTTRVGSKNGFYFDCDLLSEDVRILDRIGLRLPLAARSYDQAGQWNWTTVIVPLWMLLVPSLAGYLIFWNRSRKDSDKGFEVQPSSGKS